LIFSSEAIAAKRTAPPDIASRRSPLALHARAGQRLPRVGKEEIGRSRLPALSKAVDDLPEQVVTKG
jgi:hypothetical protein